jgi:hypothetical protein
METPGRQRRSIWGLDKRMLPVIGLIIVILIVRVMLEGLVAGLFNLWDIWVRIMIGRRTTKQKRPTQQAIMRSVSKIKTSNLAGVSLRS